MEGNGDEEERVEDEEVAGRRGRRVSRRERKKTWWSRRRERLWRWRRRNQKGKDNVKKSLIVFIVKSLLIFLPYFVPDPGLGKVCCDCSCSYLN